MKNILLIGVGGTGSKAVDIFFQKKKEFAQQNDNHITALVFDTDAGDIKRIKAATPIVMADPASVGTICDRVGKEYLREWFPCDDPAIRSQEMIRGASQWRKKSYLAFLNLMNKPSEKNKFISALEGMVKDPAAICEVYVISSIAGGTGSGSFIPIALFAKRYLRKNLGKDPIVNAMIALPDIYEDGQTPENKIKVYSNAYAILRELNAINLVARGYNEGRTEKKKSPVKFRIGHPDEPNVGVLFDASDKEFWHPGAAPFSQVFLLDKIPGMKSVTSYNIVMANSLYTILCTDIGAAFDSEFSNHELLRSQNNGSNAIYAGISTSQVCFPTETVLDYLAHQQTLDSCNNEWLVIHDMVENRIREEQQRAKENKAKFELGDGEYAKMLLEELNELVNKSHDIVDLVDRGTAIFVKDKQTGKSVKSDKNSVDKYFEVLERNLSRKIIDSSDVNKKIEDAFADLDDKTAKIEKDNVPATAESCYRFLLSYFEKSVQNIKTTATGAADSVLTLDKKKIVYVNKDISLVENILKKNDKYIHPVAAMVQLCRFRSLLTAKLPKDFEDWDALKERKIKKIQSEYLRFRDDEVEVDSGVKVNKSHYYGLGEDRFEQLRSGYDMSDVRTDAKSDMSILRADALSIANNIYMGAQEQYMHVVYAKLAKDVDLLIDKYRNFFKRLIKEREDLEELTKNALRRDAGAVDSVINVYSSEDAKKRILYEVLTASGPATEAELKETDDIVGQGVYETVYNSASAAARNDDTFNDKDSGVFRSLFANMIAQRKEYIRKSEDFARIASYNVVEAMVASCGDNADLGDKENVFRDYFATAQELATPSLKIKSVADDEDLVQPSNVLVFMISEETGRYIKKHADELGLHLPADQTNESDVIKACAEEFISNYSGNSTARVSIVKDMSDQMLYCTGEIMDISPLRIAKFDELGTDNLYYKHYSKALVNFKRRMTDMWNPHLGKDLHKRGFLPYMNEEKERQCDKLMVKALIYAFNKGIITYTNSVGDSKKFFECNGKKIFDPEGRRINDKNIAQLLAWIRNENDLIDEWSEAFDKDINRQMIALPNLASNNAKEISNLEAAITKSPFVVSLTKKFYSVDDKFNPSMLEFAYLVKTSEEIGNDCDDAERVLDVAYETFKEICAFRTNPKEIPENFIKVYMHHLKQVYESILEFKVVNGDEDQFNLVASWLYEAGVFSAIDEDNPFDAKGEIKIKERYSYNALKKAAEKEQAEKEKEKAAKEKEKAAKANKEA